MTHMTHSMTHIGEVRHGQKAQSPAALREGMTHHDAHSQENYWKGLEGGEGKGAGRGAREGAGDHNAKSASCASCVMDETRGKPPFLAMTHHDAHVRHHGPVTLAEAVAHIAARAERLRPPCHRDPHAFHDDKGELVGALRDLQRRVGRGGRPTTGAGSFPDLPICGGQARDTPLGNGSEPDLNSTTEGSLPWTR